MPTPKAGYFLKDGSKVPGTTTICGAYKDSGGLLHWAWEQGRAGFKEPGFTNTALLVWDALKGVLSFDEFKALIRDKFSGLDYRETRDKAGDIGTLVHAAIEANLSGAPLPVLDSIPHKAYRAFLRWQAQNNIEIIEQEIQLVSEEHRYGGTLDAIGIAEDEYVLLDWKTSKGVYKNYLLQLAAYAHLWNENHPDMEIASAWLVRFSKTDGICEPYFFPPEELSPAFKQFLRFREAYADEHLLDTILEKAKSCMKSL